MQRISACEGKVRIALVGKYVQLHDAYLSVAEALKHAAIHHGVNLEIDWVDAEAPDLDELLSQADGILVPGGFGGRGIEGKIAATHHARVNGIPFFGICLGMQIAVIEYARSLCGMHGANSSEFDPETPYAVIDLLPEQRAIEERGRHDAPRAPTRCTWWRARARSRPTAARRSSMSATVTGTRSTRACATRSRPPAWWSAVAAPTAASSRWSSSPDHPWFCASQFHPEFKSRPTRPQPLFREFMGAAANRARARDTVSEREPAALGG